MRARLLISAGLLLPAAPALAQTMRDFDYVRARKNETQLRAVVEFGAGRIAIKPGPPERLYGLVLQYDAERFQPVGSYNAGAAEVKLGVGNIAGGGIRVSKRNALPQVAVVELSPRVDLSLDATLGAAEGTLELGGLRLTDLDLKSGASRTSASFAVPNPVGCRTATVTTGAGEFSLTGAGNAGCRSWRIEGGVGEVTIDLDGAWPADARMTLNMALGGVTLRAPRGLGLRVTVSGFLSGFDAKGFTKNGKVYTSADYGAASRHVEIEVSSSLGGVHVEWR